MSNLSLEDNCFSTSPFSLVADELAARCWSGRKQVHRNLEELRQTLSRRADSSLDLVWANLGSGKTHTLLHFSYLLQQDSKQSFVPVFMEMPEQVRNFVDIYRRIIGELPLEHLVKVLAMSPRGKLPRNLERAANVLSANGNSAEKDIVRSWLYAEKPHLSLLRGCSNIGERIDGDLAATEILQGIVKAFEYAKCRLVLLIDEFQRIGVVKPPVRDRILSSLRTVFSRSPRYFSVILAIQSRMEQSALDLVPPELKTLMGRKPSISLPEMNVQEATDFILGRFRCFRPEGYTGDPAAPFQGQTIQTMLSYMSEKANIPLSPREILQALAYICDHSPDQNSMISPHDALRILKTYDAKDENSVAQSN